MLPLSLPERLSASRSLVSAGNHPAAKEMALELCSLFPDCGDAWKILALSQCMLKEDFLDAVQRACTLLPNDAEAFNLLGAAFRSVGRHEESTASFLGSTRIEGNFAFAHNNLGIGLTDLGDPEGALKSFREALRIYQNQAQAQLQTAIEVQRSGDQQAFAAEIVRLAVAGRQVIKARSSLLFHYCYLPQQYLPAALAEARSCGEFFADVQRPARWENQRVPERRLRVGLVSGDFRAHSVSYFLDGFMQATKVGHANLAFIGYSNSTLEDHVTDRIRQSCEAWRSIVGRSDDEAALDIRNDKIDILIDLSGHTTDNRLSIFARKPAPIQATWLGYIATTGLPAMDYVIADPWMAPPGEEAHFVEKIWRLPESFVCFTPPAFDAQVGPLPALSNGDITFGCFNNLRKLNDEVIALWSRILVLLPRAKLFLNTWQLKDAETRDRTAKRFAAHGIGAERLILEFLPTRESSIAAYNRVDIALDPFPYGGGTTTAESLWMGVPVVALAGERFVSHLGESYLNNVGLPGWIAKDQSKYLALAIAHASDLQRLAELRTGLRRQVLASPLFDAPRFARHFEEALRGMWRAWCEKENA